MQNPNIERLTQRDNYVIRKIRQWYPETKQRRFTRFRVFGSFCTHYTDGYDVYYWGCICSGCMSLDANRKECVFVTLENNIKPLRFGKQELYLFKQRNGQQTFNFDKKKMLFEFLSFAYFR